MRHPRGRLNVSRLPGGSREASPRHKDRGLGPTGRERESGNAAVARREGADARVMCVRVRRSGPARKTNSGRPAKSGQCAFSARHAPHLRVRKRDGQTPSPTKAGADDVWLFDNGMMSARCSWAHALSVRPHESGDPVFMPASQALGPRLRGDERREFAPATASGIALAMHLIFRGASQKSKESPLAAPSPPLISERSGSGSGAPASRKRLTIG